MPDTFPYCLLPTAHCHPICVVFAVYPPPSTRRRRRRLAYCQTGRYRIRL